MDPIIDMDSYSSEITEEEARTRDYLKVSQTKILLLAVEALADEKYTRRKTSLPCRHCTRQLDVFIPVNSGCIFEFVLTWRKNLSEIVFIIEGTAYRDGLSDEFMRTNFIGNPETMRFSQSASPVDTARTLISEYINNLSSLEQYSQFFNLMGARSSDILLTEPFEAVDKFSINYHDLMMFLTSGLDGSINISSSEEAQILLRKRNSMIRIVWTANSDETKASSAWINLKSHGNAEEFAKSLLESVILKTGDSCVASCGGKIFCGS